MLIQRGQRRWAWTKRQAGGVGDGVVGEDGDAGEADGSPQVEDGGEHDDDSGDEDLGAQGKSAVSVDLREPVRQLVASGHRQHGAGDAGHEVEENPERGDAGADADDGASHSSGEVATTRLSGASLAATAATGTVASSVTPTAA